MKKFILFLAIIAMSTAAYAKNNVDITRGQLWGQAIFRSKLHTSGIGIDAEYATKYNYCFSKEKNGKEVDTETQESWLHEFFIGPMWSGTLTKNLTLMSSLLYRPRGFYLIDDKLTDPNAYWRHTIFLPTTLTYKLPFMSISYRLALWNWFETSYTQRGADMEEDNGFLMLHMITLVFPMPFYKPLKVDVGYEIFHLTTAQENVQQQLYKHHVFAGLIYQPIKPLTIKLEYWYEVTFPEESDVLDKDVTDHLVKLTLAYFLDLTGKPKKREGEAVKEETQEKINGESNGKVTEEPQDDETKKE